MRVVFDLRICQTEGGLCEAAEYELALAETVAGGAGDTAEVLVALASGDPRSVERVRHALAGVLPAERVVVADLPGRDEGGRRAGAWSRQAADHVWVAFLESLHPDVVHAGGLSAAMCRSPDVDHGPCSWSAGRSRMCCRPGSITRPISTRP